MPLITSCVSLSIPAFLPRSRANVRRVFVSWEVDLEEKQPVAVSLFTGAGGKDIAAVAAGFKIIAQVEIDEYCQYELRRNHDRYYPDATLHGNVRDFGKHSIRQQPDLIAGGFPCQDVSNAGVRKGITDGTRSGLWFEFRRIISEIRPRYIFVENVPGITSKHVQKMGEIRQAGALLVVGELSTLGYVCRWGYLSAADSGAAHQRERWWLVGHTERVGHIEPEDQQQSSSHSNGISTPREQGRGSELHATVSGGPLLVNTSRTGQQKRNPTALSGDEGYPSGRSDTLRRNEFSESGLGRASDELSTWLSEYQRPALINELPECAQFEHEPPRTIPASQRNPYHAKQLKALGNSVHVVTAYALFVAIREAIEAERK